MFLQTPLYLVQRSHNHEEMKARIGNARFGKRPDFSEKRQIGDVLARHMILWNGQD